MKEVYGRVTQMGGAMLAVALIMALGVSLSREQRQGQEAMQATAGSAAPTLALQLPEALRALASQPAVNYTLANQREDSTDSRRRLVAHIVVTGSLDDQKVAAVQAAQALLKANGAAAVAVLVYSSVEAEQRTVEESCQVRYLYAPDGGGWEGGSGQPVGSFDAF